MVFPRFQWGLRDRCQTLQKLRHRRSSRCLRSSDAGPLDVYEVARCQNWLSKSTFPVCRMDFPYAQHEFQELRGRCGRSRPFFSQVWIGWNLQIFAQCAMVMGIFRLFVLVLLAFRYASPVCGAKERTRYMDTFASQPEHHWFDPGQHIEHIDSYIETWGGQHPWNPKHEWASCLSMSRYKSHQKM